MSEAFNRYRHLERDLIYIRWQHAGFESEEEDTILDAMEKVWYEMSEKEQQLLYSEGTRSLIRNTGVTISFRARTQKDIWRKSNFRTPARILTEVA